MQQKKEKKRKGKKIDLIKYEKQIIDLHSFLKTIIFLIISNLPFLLMHNHLSILLLILVKLNVLLVLTYTKQTKRIQIFNLSFNSQVD